MSRPVLRFAPSPTGYLHIGGARTALFNWLYARHTGGRYLLRIEDTDKERSTEAATNALIEGLKWLGLDWDGDIYLQSRHEARHAEVAHELLAKGAAYKCYATAEELKAFREANPHAKFQSPWRDKEGPSGQPFSIRIKAPQTEGEIVVLDAVQGDVRVAYSELDDFILLRSDGTPTYLLAVVVDDRDMGITHVIRGDDHLTNTFRQWLIFQGMGWDVPVFAHLPMIHGADGAKLSKRHGSLAVDEYRKMGFLPEAMCNYLLRVGWGHGDTELITKEDAAKIFDLSDVNKAPGRLDFKKMEAVNAHYLKEADNGRLVDLVIADAKARGLLQVEETLARTRLLAGMDDLKSRVKTTIQLTEEAHFYLKKNPLDVDSAASDILKTSINILISIQNTVSIIEGWTSETLEAACKNLAHTDYDGKLAEIMKPLRAALTGRTASPALPHIMVALGREETLARIREAQAI